MDHPALHVQKAMYAATVAGDWGAYAEHLARDYVSRGPDGAVKDRQRTVVDWRENTEAVQALDVTPERVVEVSPDVVMVFARYDCVDVRCGAARRTEGAMTEVFRREADGTWKCVGTTFA